MKKVMIFGLILTLTVMTNAFSQTEADFTVGLTADYAGVVILNYTGTVTQVRIPAIIQDMPVREIGKEAFSEIRTAITSVVIPNGVTVIGEAAFQGASRLASVTVPDTVTRILDSTFNGCGALTSFTIPNSVTTIGALAFYGCSKLESLTIPSGVTSVGVGAFSYSGLKSVTWPAGVTKIQYGMANYSEYGMFSNCGSLQTVIISEGVTEIGDSTFSGCSALTSVTIPNSVTTIGAVAFLGCSKLESIAIPAGVTAIGGGAFTSSGLKTVTWPARVTKIQSGGANYREYGMFSNCRSLQTVIISEGVTEIGTSAFSECPALTSVTLPSTIREIGTSAFLYCSALTTVTIPDTVGSISFPFGYYAEKSNSFNGCSKLTLASQAALRRRGYTGDF